MADPPVSRRHNLPNQATSFIGREREIADVKKSLSTTRLLTLTGVGGTGKTRLALKIATDILQGFADGTWMTELAASSESSSVVKTVASALRVSEQPGRPLMDTLVDYLSSRSLLLILDNCEHLLSACAQLANALMRACPNLQILATSREQLGITGEVAYRVPALSVPDLHHLPSLEHLTV